MMISLRYILLRRSLMELLLPILGILTGIIVPVSVFIWLYFESKDKNKTILEISKNIDDPSKLEDLIGMFDKRTN